MRADTQTGLAFLDTPSQARRMRKRGKQRGSQQLVAIGLPAAGKPAAALAAPTSAHQAQLVPAAAPQTADRPPATPTTATQTTATSTRPGEALAAVPDVAKTAPSPNRAQWQRQQLQEASKRQQHLLLFQAHRQDLNYGTAKGPAATLVAAHSIHGQHQPLAKHYQSINNIATTTTTSTITTAQTPTTTTTTTGDNNSTGPGAGVVVVAVGSSSKTRQGSARHHYHYHHQQQQQQPTVGQLARRKPHSRPRMANYRVDMADFELLKVLGTGAYGKVFLVRKLTGHDQGRLYAMKVLRKEIVAQKAKTLDHTRTERKVLEAIRNESFLVTMHYAFQTKTKLHLILDYVNGGELFTHLYQRDHFKEDDVRIYIAELILALEKLHKVSVKRPSKWWCCCCCCFCWHLISGFRWHLQCNCARRRATGDAVRGFRCNRVALLARNLKSHVASPGRPMSRQKVTDRHLVVASQAGQAGICQRQHGFRSTLRSLRWPRAHSALFDVIRELH